jgi:EAL domain-containing protein (putative c-di-GMP-specific phosphodiesterase class I)
MRITEDNIRKTITRNIKIVYQGIFTLARVKMQKGKRLKGQAAEYTALLRLKHPRPACIFPAGCVYNKPL